MAPPLEPVAIPSQPEGTPPRRTLLRLKTTGYVCPGPEENYRCQRRLRHRPHQLVIAIQKHHALRRNTADQLLLRVPNRLQISKALQMTRRNTCHHPHPGIGQFTQKLNVTPPSRAHFQNRNFIARPQLQHGQRNPQLIVEIPGALNPTQLRCQHVMQHLPSRRFADTASDPNHHRPRLPSIPAGQRLKRCNRFRYQQNRAVSFRRTAASGILFRANFPGQRSIAHNAGCSRCFRLRGKLHSMSLLAGHGKKNIARPHRS